MPRSLGLSRSPGNSGGDADTGTLPDDDIPQYNLALLHLTLPVPPYVSVNDKAREYDWIPSSLLCNTLI